jgi:hypothetical protein
LLPALLALPTLLVSVAVLSGAGPASASTGTFYVAAGSTDSGSCGSSASPCLTITQALANAASALVTSPTIYVSGTIANDDITVSGAIFSGTVTIEKNPSDSGTAEVTEASSDTNSLFVIENGATVMVSGLSLDGLSHGGNNDGGAIYDDSTGRLTVANDSFDALAYDNGGSIAVSGGGALTATGDIFDHAGTEAGDGGAGGAIWVQDGTTVNVTNSDFESDSSAGDGGAITMDDSAATLTVVKSTFSGNVSAANGGAIAIDSASPLTVTDSTFYENEAGQGTSTGDGGAIDLGSAATGTGAEIVGSTFDANTAGADGGPLGTTDTDSSGNNLYVATVAAAPTLAADLFYGTCALNINPVDDGYNVAYDSSCLPANPASTDVKSPSASDISGLETEPGAAAGTQQTVVVGAANPAAALIPSGTALLCPTTDEAGVASSGSCNAGASQVTTARPALYVAAGGSDTSNDCTVSTSPCLKVSYAITQENQYELHPNPTVYQDSDPTVYVSGVIADDNIAVAGDATITQYTGPDAATAEINGASLGSDDEPLFDITGGTVSIDDITIENAQGYGAVLDNDPATVTFSDDILADNSESAAPRQGGAIADDGTGTVAVSNDTFTDDSASTGSGGSIWVGDGGSVNVSNSSFSGTAGADYGGAIAVADNGTGGGTLDVSGSTFTGLSAAQAGGAIANDVGGSSGAGSVTVTGSTFASDDAPEGGAILNGDYNAAAATLSVSDSLFSSDGSLAGSGDSASWGGAILNGYDTHGGAATATLTDSSFVGDDSYYDGGAVDNAEEGGISTLTVIGSTFENDATEQNANLNGGFGGAIDNGDTTIAAGSAGTLAVLDSTFANDTVGGVSGTSELINNDTVGGATLAGNIFDGSCSEGSGASWTDDGYNVAITGGHCTNAGTADTSVANEADLDLGAPTSENDETLEPTFASPAVGLIPNPTTVLSNPICPLTDALGNTGPVYMGDCNAGAVQAYTPLEPTGTATNVVATAGVDEATVTWTPPTPSQAGGAIIDYTVTPFNVTTGQAATAHTTTGDVDSLTLIGLTSGDAYYFTVVMHNSAYAGSASGDSNSVTVATTPPATTTTPVTTTPITTTPIVTLPPPTKTSTGATVDNQQITLTYPSMNVCEAPSKKLSVILTSKAVTKSTKAKLKLKQAAFYLDGHQKLTSGSDPAHVSLSLKGLKKGAHSLALVITYSEALSHHRTRNVLKRLTVKFKVC